MSGVALSAGGSLRCVTPRVRFRDIQARAPQQEADNLEVPVVRGNVDWSLVARVGSIRVDTIST